MTNDARNDKAIEGAITRALEERREIAVPEDFAARVCSSLPAKAAVRRKMSVGKTVAMVMVVVTLSAVFVLASRAPMNFANLAFDVECALMLQLAAIMYWLAARRES